MFIGPMQFPVRVDDGVSCTCFLHRISTPQLSNISIKYNEHALSAEVNDFLLSSHTSCPVSPSWKRSLATATETFHIGILASTTHSLLTFSGVCLRLTVVKVLATGKFHLDDGFMEAAAVA
jgi:hypothetical protein